MCCSAPTTLRWCPTSTIREVCIHALCLGWCNRFCLWQRPNIFGWFSTPPWDLEPLDLAPVGDQHIDSGLSTEVLETKLNARGPSTRCMYAVNWSKPSWRSCRHPSLRVYQPLHWNIFSSVCCQSHAFSLGLLGVALSGLSHSAYCYCRWLRPFCRPHLPSWDLSVVLEGLREAPTEPTEYEKH